MIGIGPGSTQRDTMYLPRGKLLALIAVVVAASMVAATGAFSSVQAERTAEINVVGDKNAYLAIYPANTSNGQAYATIKNGKFKLALNENKQGGMGINKDAVTTMNSVIAITNQGTQPVKVTVDEKKDSTAVTFYESSHPADSVEDSGVKIEPGETLEVGLKIDTTGKVTEKSLIDTLVITAKSDDANINMNASSP